MNKINKIKLLVYLVVSLISVLSMFAVSVLAADHIIINKVYVDPIATEAGGEAIELYNPTAQDADISVYKIMTESSGSDITIPQLTVIKAQHYYLIADLGWNVLKDNASWPNADHEEAMTMYNTDSGIALATAGGQIIDAVGWGNPLMMDAYLFETTPTSNPAPGTVIKRINFQDTDINLNDFISAQPLFFNSTLFEPNAPEPDPVPDNETDDEDGTDSEEIGLPILVNVTNSLPSIVSFNFTIDDSEDEGYQVMPLPGAAKHVPLSVLIEDNDGSSDISKVSAVVTAQDYVKEYVLEKLQNLSDGALYSGNISLDYFSAPTQYIVTLSAYDNAN